MNDARLTMVNAIFRWPSTLSPCFCSYRRSVSLLACHLLTRMKQVHPKLRVPVNALLVTSGITFLLSLINIGSKVALNAIISLQLSALMSSYTVSIGCVLYRRLKHPELLPPARWRLGRFGVAINGLAVIYSSYTFFWCFWPLETPVDASSFN